MGVVDEEYSCRQCDATHSLCASCGYEPFGLVGGRISCLWVYACHVGWGVWLREVWIHHRKRLFTAIAVGVGIMVLAGYLLFSLKPDSARGRLFMWKITYRAIMEKPLAGHGTDNFAVAYGKAQEDYFATGNYEPWEERVAGSPEYAFNEYLQAAVEWGVPLTLCGLAAIVICLYIGIKKSRYGICGAILSLLIFLFLLIRCNFRYLLLHLLRCFWPVFVGIAVGNG